MPVGIAGTDENRITEHARSGLGIAGDTSKGKLLAGARFGVSGLDRPSKVAVAGLNCQSVATAGRVAVLGDVAQLKQRDAALAAITRDSKRLGDRAARESWRHGVWFADFTYLARADGTWRAGREDVFGRSARELPLFIDSCGYRREITGTAPHWAHDASRYPAVIELLDPDGYAAWDFPNDRKRSMAGLHELMQAFPADVSSGRMWPVFSMRWAWDDRASLAQAPAWAGRNLAGLIPLNRTQKPFAAATREEWARVALANALVLAADPDFRFMAERFGQIMLGGMVAGPCPRMARHIYAAALCHLFPGVKFWLLGQANFAVINGLGMLGLLDQVWTDGTWWIKDATADRFAIVEDGLITMLSLESNYRMQPFFTTIEMMAANLRSLLAAYQGLWTWPPPEPLPLDLLDVQQAGELRRRFQTAQLELGL